MPRYFFHTEDGCGFQDNEGSELPDDHTARNEAVALLAALVRDDPDGFWAHPAFRLEVADAAGRTLFELELGATAPPTADPEQK